MGEQDTLTFRSKADLACHLFDRTLTASMTGIERLRLARLAAVAADHLWEEHGN